MKGYCTSLLTAAAGALAVSGLASAGVLSTTQSDARPVVYQNGAALGLVCGDEMITQNADTDTIVFPNVPACNGNETTETWVARTWAAGELGDICAVTFGIGEIQGTQQATSVDVVIKQGAAAGADPTTMPVVAQTTVNLPAGDAANGQFFDAVFSSAVVTDPSQPVTVALRLEAPVGSGTFIFPAGNESGEFAPTYFAAAGCGLPTYITAADIGFPEAQVILKVYSSVGASCDGDVNGDGVVDISDMLAVLDGWGTCGDPSDCAADVNGDGVVDIADMLAVLDNWGSCPEPPAPTGACCFEDGSCVADVTADDCAGIDGNYGGNYSTCVVCPQPPDGSSCSDAFELGVGDAIDANTEGKASPNVPGCNGVNPSTQGGVWFKVEGTGTQLLARADSGITGAGSYVSVYCGSCSTPVCVGSGTQNSNGDNPFDGEVEWCAGDGETYYVVVWLAVGEGDVSVSLQETGGACTPTIDCHPALDSCVGNCGDQAPAGCWCDESCCDFSDCCPDKFEACGGCAPAGPVECDGVNCNDTEGEPCGDDTNGGCNSDIPVFDSIAFGETVCGNTWADDGTRDTDWYLFTITEETTVTWTVSADEEIAAIIVGSVDSCDDAFVIDSAVGCDVAVTTCLQPGNYVAFVGASVFEGYPCPGFAYEATLTGEAGECQGGGGGDNSCVGNCGASAPSGCWCDEDCCDFSDCCPDKFATCGGCVPPGQAECDGVSCNDNEGEACGDDTNGGCNSDFPVFDNISLGETVCGNAWAEGDTRDTDWYYFTLTEDTMVTWTVSADEEIAAIIAGGVDGCEDPVVIDSAVGCDVVVTTCLKPGNYVAFVGAATFDGHPCPGFAYQATLTGASASCP